jgi:hypothetical protein
MKMRNNFYREIFSFCLLFVIAGYCHAQKLRVNGYGSYVLDGTYHIYYVNDNLYEGRINHGLQLGLGAEYLVTPNYGIELSYLRRNTNVFPEGTVNSNRVNAALRFQYILLGINAYAQTCSRKLQPFGGMSTGIIVQSALSTNDISNNAINHSITKFAWAARLGGVLCLSSRVGVKLQAQWLSALQFKNGAVNFDVHRPEVGQAEYSIANQFELGGGVIIKVGKAADKE